ncbi:putative ferric-chelate reductase 1 [Ptychodera flava]|uniref:putative ferric-chelate reductase 1 n=1 Tax=Ptychodera flava TaxID=63121 RepID=UPI00396A2FE7
MWAVFVGAISLILLRGSVHAQQKLVTATGCSSTKGCFMSPAGCTDVEDCDVMVTWAPKAGSDLLMTIEILGKLRPGEMYVGVGFSKDEYMGSDDVWSCVSSGGQVTVDHSVNHDKHNVPLMLADGTVTDFTGIVENSAIQCTFTRPKAIIIQTEGHDPENFDLAEDYHLFIVRAGVWSMGGRTLKGKHREVPIITKNRIDFSAMTVDSGIAQRPILLKCHGALMVFGWIGCASIAIMLAKHFKIIWPNSSLCGEKVWFGLHRSLMMFNFLCFVVDSLSYSST